jgi:hypothetical protein
VKSEPEGVRNTKNQLRTGAGEIGRVKATSAFVTALDGPTNFRSEWMSPDSRRASEWRKPCQPAAVAAFGPIRRCLLLRDERT